MKQHSPAFHSGALGFIAGLAGSLCCLGPSVALLLGLGSSSALAGLAFSRSAALASGAVLLAGGLSLAWRQARTCKLPGRAHRHTAALALLVFALTYAVFGYVLPIFAARQADRATAAIAPAAQGGPIQLRHATLIIEKMTCPPCAASVRSALARKPYVVRFVAEEGDEQVTIDYDSRVISARALAQLFPRRYGVIVLDDRADR